MPGSSKARLLNWSEVGSPEDQDDDAAHVMLAPIAGRGEESKTLNRWLKRVEFARDAAERKRLFYVACTRAREELHLFATPETTVGGTINPHYLSLLKSAWPAAAPRFAPDLSAPSELELAASAAPASESNKCQGISVIRSISNPLDDVLASPLHPALQRLPLAFDPAARFGGARTLKLPYGDPGDAPGSGEALFFRPPCSFAARSLGTGVSLAEGWPASPAMSAPPSMPCCATPTASGCSHPTLTPPANSPSPPGRGMGTPLARALFAPLRSAPTASSAPARNPAFQAKSFSGLSTTRRQPAAPAAWRTSSPPSAKPTPPNSKPTPASSPRRSPNRSARSVSRFTSPPCRASPGGNPPPPLRPDNWQLNLNRRRAVMAHIFAAHPERSEERRVGKECRSR